MCDVDAARKTLRPPSARLATVPGMKRALPCPFRTTTPETVPAR